MNPNKNYVYQSGFLPPNQQFIKTSGTSLQPNPPQYINPSKSHILHRIKTYTTNVDQIYGNPEQQRFNNFGRPVYRPIQRPLSQNLNYQPQQIHKPQRQFAYYKQVQPGYQNQGLPLRLGQRLQKQNQNYFQPHPMMARQRYYQSREQFYQPNPQGVFGRDRELSQEIQGNNLRSKSSNLWNGNQIQRISNLFFMFNRRKYL